MKPWTVKYQPKDTSEIQGQNKAIKELLDYIENFKNGQAALIYGPPGSGKTSAVYAIARELDLEIIEVNASDTRNKDSLNQKLGPAVSQMSLFSKGKIILVDEIDGVAGRKDRGGVSELRKIIKKTSFPIVMTANDPWDKKFSTLRKTSNMIEFRTLAYTSVMSVLKRIAEEENIDYNESALKSLARRAGGDLRGAVSDFQTLAQSDKKLTKDEIDELSGRKQKESMITALMRILKTTSPEVALPALDDVDEDIDKIFLWIDENLPKEYKKPKDLTRAYDNLSMADVFYGRIRRWQHWRFLVYIYNLLTAGIALSKDEKYPGFTKYTRTKRILKMWQFNQKNAKKKAIAEKIAEKTHTSSKRVITDTFPYIQIIFKKDEKQAERLAKYLDLDKKEIAYIKS